MQDKQLEYDLDILAELAGLSDEDKKLIANELDEHDEARENEK